MTNRIKWIVEFLRRKHAALALWDRGGLEDYAGWHLQNGSLTDVWDGDQVKAVFVGWPCAPGDFTFAWKPWDSSLPCFYIASIAADPGALRPLLRGLAQRFPDELQKEIFARRNGVVSFGKANRAMARLARLARRNRIPLWEHCMAAASKILEAVKGDYPACENAMAIDVDAPEPRDIAQEGRDTLQAQIELAPAQFRAEAQYRPKYAELGLQTLLTTLLGSQGMQDYKLTGGNTGSSQGNLLNPSCGAGATGSTCGRTSSSLGGQGQTLMTLADARNRIGQICATGTCGTNTAATGGTGVAAGQAGSVPGLLEILEQIVNPAASRIQSAANTAQRAADVADVYNLSPAAMEAMRRTDPERAALLDQLTNQATSELGLGTAMDPSMQRLVQQSVRSGQAARGLGYGPTDVWSELLATSQFGDQLRNQRRTFAQGVINQRSNVYGDPFLQILGRPSGTNPQSYVSQGQQLGYQEPSMFDPWNAYASDLYNTNYNAEAAANIGSANSLSGLLGGLLGAGGTLGGASILACWVAREVYGPENPRWLLFRDYVLNRAPAWFRNLYLAHGPRVAEIVRANPWMRAPIRAWMDKRICHAQPTHP